MEQSTAAMLRRALADPIIDKITGSPKNKYWQEVEKTQYLSENELYKRQWEKLRGLLSYIYEKNLFYRNRLDKAGIHPCDIKSKEDFEGVPVLSKNDVREQGLNLITNGFNTSDLMHFKTGGSTGKALDLYITEECSEMRNAVALRHDQWSGWKYGEPVGAVWGNPKLPKTLKEKARYFLLKPTIYLDTMDITDSSVKFFAAQWKKMQPTILFGHAHSLFILAQMVEKLGIEEIWPKGIVSTSMMLMPHERSKIQKSFNADVFDRYGCEEVSLISSECEYHEGLHLNIEHLYVEFLNDDGSPVKQGEGGKIIVTDLMNRAMPFVRYQVEDIGVPIERKCSCGRGLPLMGSVTGRIADFLIRHDGSRVAGVSLIENTLTKYAGIEQMQIVQESLDALIINVVPAKGYNHDTKQQLMKYFNELFQEKARVDLRLVNEILPEPSGKYRFSICKLNKREG